MLANQCFEYSDLEYTYKLCAFESASQRPKNGGSETRLGNWERWSGNELEPYSQMSYTRGAQCWNGPTRYDPSEFYHVNTDRYSNDIQILGAKMSGMYVTPLPFQQYSPLAESCISLA